MSAADRTRPSPEESAATLLDEVMRGERAVLLPPGAWAVSLFMPCLCVAAALLGVLLAACVVPLDEPAGTARILLPMGIAIGLVAVATAGQALIILGRAAARLALVWYVRGLLLSTFVLGAALALGWIEAPGLFPAIAAMALFACHRLLDSWSYLAVTAFFSLKRRYREDARAASERVLRGKR